MELAERVLLPVPADRAQGIERPAEALAVARGLDLAGMIDRGKDARGVRRRRAQRDTSRERFLDEPANAGRVISVRVGERDAIHGLGRVAPLLQDLEQRQPFLRDLAPVHDEPSRVWERDHQTFAVARAGDEDVQQRPIEGAERLEVGRVRQQLQDLRSSTRLSYSSSRSDQVSAPVRRTIRAPPSYSPSSKNPSASSAG